MGVNIGRHLTDMQHRRSDKSNMAHFGANFVEVFRGLGGAYILLLVKDGASRMTMNDVAGIVFGSLFLGSLVPDKSHTLGHVAIPTLISTDNPEARGLPQLLAEILRAHQTFSGPIQPPGACLQSTFKRS